MLIMEDEFTILEDRFTIPTARNRKHKPKYKRFKFPTHSEREITAVANYFKKGIGDDE